jgi:hypothetical protein
MLSALFYMVLKHVHCKLSNIFALLSVSLFHTNFHNSPTGTKPSITKMKVLCFQSLGLRTSYKHFDAFGSIHWKFWQQTLPLSFISPLAVRPSKVKFFEVRSTPQTL